MRLCRLSIPMLASLAGCSLSTGIVPVGPGIYALSEQRAPVLGGGPEAHRAVLAEAERFCGQQRSVARILDLHPDGDPFTPYYPTAFDATFQCVAPVGAPAAVAAGGKPDVPGRRAGS